MVSAEPGRQLQGLELYRSIDVNYSIGGMPVSDYAALREACGDTSTLSPEQRLDYGWLTLETAMAMYTQQDPATGKWYRPQDAKAMFKAASKEFGTVASDGHATAEVRARAVLAQSSIDLYSESVSGQAPGYSGNHVALLKGIKAAARRILEQPEISPSEADLLNGMAGMAIYMEYAYRAGWVLPASPRQPWQFSAVDAKNGVWAGYSVTDDEAPAGVVSLGTSTLGNNTWSEQSGPFATIRSYVDRVVPGSLPPNRQSKPGIPAPRKAAGSAVTDPGVRETFRSIARDFLGEIVDRIQETGEGVNVRTIAGATAVAETVERPSLFDFQVNWYGRQSALSERDIDVTTLDRYIAEMGEANNRTPAETRTLGWMQLDRAHLYMAEARSLVARADELRRGAENISTVLRPARYQEANDIEQRARAQIEAAMLSFEQSAAAMNEAAGGLEKSRPGEAIRAHFEALAIPVYRDLALGSQGIAATVDGYYRQVAHLQVMVNNAFRGRLQDPAQNDILNATLRSAALAGIFAGRASEGLRHLALPASPRSTGSMGRLDALVFPQVFDSSRDGFAYGQTPVSVQFVETGGVAFDRRHVTVNRSLLPPSLLASLARQIRSTQRTRSDEITALSERLAYAVDDALNS
jgi:hypothetical protein